MLYLRVFRKCISKRGVIFVQTLNSASMENICIAVRFLIDTLVAPHTARRSSASPVLARCMTASSSLFPLLTVLRPVSRSRRGSSSSRSSAVSGTAACGFKYNCMRSQTQLMRHTPWCIIVTTLHRSSQTTTNQLQCICKR